jgi:hypothetical protein
MKKRSEIALSLLLLITAVWVLSQSSTYFLNQLTGWGLPRGWGPRSGLFPTVFGSPLLILTLVQLISAIRRKEPSPAPKSGPSPEADGSPEAIRWRTMGIVAAIVGFPVAVWLVGFTLAILLVTFLYLKIAARERWRISLILSVSASLIFHVVFALALGIPMPDGALLAPLEI